MFQFPPFATTYLCIQYGLISHNAYRVAPFGNPRIKTYVQFPVAYRR